MLLPVELYYGVINSHLRYCAKVGFFFKYHCVYVCVLRP